MNASNEVMLIDVPDMIPRDRNFSQSLDRVDTGSVIFNSPESENNNQPWVSIVYWEKNERLGDKFMGCASEVVIATDGKYKILIYFFLKSQTGNYLVIVCVFRPHLR